MNQPAAVLTTPPPAPAEPRFFVETWKMLLASARDAYRYVWVSGGVASVTDGHVLLRAKRNMPDGFYLFDAVDNLVPVRVADWTQYPNIEAAQPPFAKMRPSCQLTHEHVQHLLSFVEHAAGCRSHVVIDAKGLCLQKDHTVCIDMPFGNVKEQVIMPERLRLALREMLRYPDCYLSQEETFGQDTAPIVFGNNWAQCALVTPGYSYHYGRY